MNRRIMIEGIVDADTESQHRGDALAATFSSTTPASHVSTPIAMTIAVTLTTKRDQRRGDTAIQDQQDRDHQWQQDHFDSAESGRANLIDGADMRPPGPPDGRATLPR